MPLELAPTEDDAESALREVQSLCNAHLRDMLDRGVSENEAKVVQYMRFHKIASQLLRQWNMLVTIRHNEMMSGSPNDYARDDDSHLVN